MQYFELDHGATQRDKVRRAPGSGPTYVEADLAVQGAADALRAGGIDASRPALVVVEGVTVYLDGDIVRSQLAALASTSAPGSRLLANFYPPSAPTTSEDRRQAWLQRLARVGSGENFRLRVSRAEATELVADAGWNVDENTSLREASRALVPRSSGLAIDATDENISLIAASRA